MPRIDWRAVGFGAAVVLVVAVPAGVLGGLILEKGSNLAFLFVIPIYLAFVAGGYVAGAKRPDAPLAHGAAAAFAGFVVAQAVSIALQLARDDEVNALAVLFNALLSANVGLFGGWLGGRRDTDDSVDLDAGASPHD